MAESAYGYADAFLFCIILMLMKTATANQTIAGQTKLQRRMVCTGTPKKNEAMNPIMLEVVTHTFEGRIDHTM